jgi:hypothetical protein
MPHSLDSPRIRSALGDRQPEQVAIQLNQPLTADVMPLVEIAQRRRAAADLPECTRK